MTALFANPAMLAAVAAVPLLAALAWHAHRQRRHSIAILGDPPMLALQVIDRGRPIMRAIGWGLAIGLLAFAAAGPRWGSGPPPAIMPGCDVMLVVDLSRSMLARDALPNRLERAKDALADLVDAAQRRGGHRIGVVAFAGRAQVVCPLTNDYDHVRAKLASLSANPLPPDLESTGASGTRIGAGMAAAVAAHEPPFRGAQMIVLVSDGDDPANDGEWRNAYAVARAAQIPVFTIGIGDPARDSPIPFGDATLTFRGTPVLTRLHEEPLREIASRTKGTYVTGGAAKPDLTGFVRDTLNQFPTREAIAGTLPQPAPRQLWFLLPALALFLVLVPPIAASRAGGRARQMAAAAALVLIGAASVSDAELRRGIVALDSGKLNQALVHFAAAAERSTDPGLVAFNEGIALYRLDRFREAEGRFRWALSDAEGARRASALYNLGCALLQSSQGRRAEPLKHAVTAFEQALANADLDSDVRVMARDNLELAKRLLAQAPPESPSAPPGAVPENPAPPSGSDAANPGGTEKPAVPERARNERSATGVPQVADRPPPPGKGSLPPLPDDEALAPLTPEDARAHLDSAAARIAAARAAKLRTRAAMPSTQFPDW